MRAALSALDARNAGRYQSNAAALLDRLRDRDRHWRERLEPVRDVPYLVFHDAYRYLEQHFGLHPAGAVVVSPEQPPGARHVAYLRAILRETGARCVFREPQFRARVIHVLVEGTGARVAVLDPVGASVEPGPEAWFRMMDMNVEALASCLGGEGG